MSLFFWLIPYLVFAQTSFILKGTVSDADINLLPGATVFIHELNTGTITDINGSFIFPKIKPGSYHMHIYYTGYETGVRTFKITNANEDLTIVLKSTSLELKAFVIEESTLNIDDKERSMSVEVINREFIEKNAGTSFGHTLEKIPGISAISLGTGISKPVIRGMSFNRIAIAENGIKQEGQQWGADHGLEIDQFNVDRVEIVKGPASLIYGSDAMGGVINIRPPVMPHENTFSSSVLLNGATNNDLVGTSAMFAANKKGNILRIRMSHQNYADYRVPADSFAYNDYVLPIEGERLKNTAGIENNISIATGLLRNWGHSTITFSKFDQHSGLFPGAHGIPRAYKLQHDGDFRNIELPAQRTKHYKLISNSNLLIRENWLSIDIGFQQNHRQELSVPHAHGKGPTPENNLELDLLLQTYTANIRYQIEKTDKLNRVFGVSGNFQQHSRGGFQFLIPDYTSGNVAGFVFQKYKVNKSLFLNAGLRYDQTTLQIKEYLEPIYEDSASISGYNLRNNNINRNYGNFSGGVGLSWIPSEYWNIKFNLGSSFRTPSPNELASNGIHHGAFRHEMGDSALVSERGYQLDLGISWHKSDLYFSLTPFFYYFDNYIFLTPSGRFSTLIEAGQVYNFKQTQAITTGAEFKTDYHFSKAFHLGLTGEYVFAHDISAQIPLPFTPPFSAEVEAEYELESKGNFEKTFFNLNIKAFSAQNYTARNEPSTPGYVLLNFSSGTNIKIKKQKIQMIFSINNITNRKYFNHLSRYRILNLPEPGRNFRITMIIPFEGKINNKQNQKTE